MIIDAHAHLWKTQTGRRDDRPVRSLRDGLADFGGILYSGTRFFGEKQGRSGPQSGRSAVFQIPIH